MSRLSVWLRRFGVAVALILLLLTGAGLLFWFGQRSLIYYPDRADPGSITYRVGDGRDVELVTQDGLTLNAWLIPAQSLDQHVAVLYLPGNAGNRLGRLRPAEALADLGYTVLMLDYRGYGGNPGHPSEAGLIQDASAAVAFLHDQGFPGDRIVYLGESIGTGVAIQLATTHNPAGIVLRSPYTSLVDVAEHHYPFLPADLMLRDRFETVANLPRVTAPIAVLCGGADSLIPTSQSVTVAEQAKDLRFLEVVDGADHNDSIWYGPYLAEQVDRLARMVIKSE